MPLNTDAKSQPRQNEVRHKIFLSARRRMHLASKAEGMAGFLFEECCKARNKANTVFNTFSQAAKEEEQSSPIFKNLSDAETSLQKQNSLLKEAEAKLEVAKQKYTIMSASFEKAKINCEQAGCPEFHGLRDVIPDISKEELMAEETANEEQEEPQTNASKKRELDDAEKEKLEARKAAEWEQIKEKYRKDQVIREEKRKQMMESHRESERLREKRLRDEYEKENPPNHAGSKRSNEHEDERPSKRSYQDGPSSEPGSKKPRPNAQQRCSAAEPVAKSSNYQEWILTVEEAFKDYASLSTFPSPPASPCSKPTCKNETQTKALAACACNVRQYLNHLTVSQLKKCRALFHPDKFGKCREDLVDDFKKQATAMFVVVDAMYLERKG